MTATATAIVTVTVTDTVIVEHENSAICIMNGAETHTATEIGTGSEIETESEIATEIATVTATAIDIVTETGIETAIGIVIMTDIGTEIEEAATGTADATGVVTTVPALRLLQDATLDVAILVANPPIISGRLTNLRTHSKTLLTPPPNDKSSIIPRISSPSSRLMQLLVQRHQWLLIPRQSRQELVGSLTEPTKLFLKRLNRNISSNQSLMSKPSLQNQKCP